MGVEWYVRVEAALDRIAHRLDPSARRSITLMVRHPDTGWIWQWQQPEANRRYFLTSTTALYTAALMMQLRREGLIDLDDRVEKVLGSEVITGVHRLDGIDYGHRITLRHLLGHTSGIGERQGALLDDVLAFDRRWSFDEVVEQSRRVPARFPPGTPGRAHYSDMNYQILGQVIEAVTGGGYSEALHSRILRPLALTDTYSFSEQSETGYQGIAPLAEGGRRVDIPHAIASLGASGGLVSTARDSSVFLEAFMRGKLFPQEYLWEMVGQWNRLDGPAEPPHWVERLRWPGRSRARRAAPAYQGIGLMRHEHYTFRHRSAAAAAVFPVADPADPVEMLGHSGRSGTMLHFLPDAGLYISGTINQLRGARAGRRVLNRVVGALYAA